MSGWGHEPSEERGQAPWSAADTQAYGGVHHPARTGGPHRLFLAVLAAVVIGVGAGAGVWALLRDGGAGSPPGATPGTNVTVTSAPPTTATPGYRRVQDPVGYALLVPEDWIRRQRQGEEAPVVFYDAPDDGRQLQIFKVTEPTLEKSLSQAETAPGYGFATRPGYQPLARDSGPGFEELTYRYDDEDKGPRLVVDHRFEAADGTRYAIRASGPEDLAPERVRAPLTTALTSFCPTGADCT
ncbi:hypothetical protein [Streptomyces cupreus]|nr:hypothetical protein [Streptomyces cupreus]